MTDTHMLMFGDGSPAGTGVAVESNRWPQLLAAALSLTPHVYAVEGAGYTVGGGSVLSQLTVAAADTSVMSDAVGLVCIAAGYNDAILGGDVGDTASQLFTITTTLRKRYTNAKIVVMIGPQGVKQDDFNTTFEPFYLGLSAAARTVSADSVVDMWDWLFNHVDDVQSDGVHPNEAGHTLIATQMQPLIPDINVPDPPDLNPVEPLGVRKYAPGRADWTKDSLRAERVRNQEKNQANSASGSEIPQTTIKLDALTKELATQQRLTTSLTAQLSQNQQQLQVAQQELQSQQKKLEDAQDEIKRVTPTISTVPGTSAGGSLGSGWTNLISLTAKRDTSNGKTRAQVTITVTAVKPGDGLPLLECLVGGTRVASFPGVTANGDSFGGTAGATITTDQPVVLRGKSTTADASPVSGVSMSLSIMSIA
ncbi:SGNH/GDSL hydrolase family protein [Bifidobacterium sp.]|jgi:lysophospholipase L1-like esterase|uniref:SGNH/GDSL hydrolase family protein n=1 Tax=Bifidobacterium sp. TaxID=41200 RepID=UPI0025BD9280|nr:SGNH/GDSL hydrolase family protein [Bifidobacterium sp.]MCI1635214.1 SGNH/GDSL hydrolase family protein [Bifidobacterium sp.]